MNVEELLQFHNAFSHLAYQVMKVKNHDYAGADGETPFRNFESVEALGVAKTEQGLIIRMIDKINRLSTFSQSGKLEVLDEKATDALLDIVNYAVLLAAYLKKKGLEDA
jgi:hypothetical protein